MQRDIKESDWKLFRKVRELALERFCQRVLDEVEALKADVAKSAHERYIGIYRLTRERDRELADMFNAPGRSVAAMQLCMIARDGLVTEEELAQFSAELRGHVERFRSYHADKALDHKIAGDAEAGSLDRAADEAISEFRAGRAREL
jgi:hypothetical protein